MKKEIEDLKEKIMTDIEAGKITSTPRWKVMMWGVGIVFLLISFFVFSSFIFSYIFFNLRFTGIGELLLFGSRGWLMFFAMLPWKYVIMDIVVLLLIFHLAKHFRLFWQSSRVVILFALAGGAIIVGFLIDQTSIHEMVFDMRDDIPGFARMMYDDEIPGGPDFTRGIILYGDDNDILIVDERTGDIGEIPNFEGVRTNLKFGDCVVVAGQRIGGIIKAFGIARQENCFGR